MTTDVPAPRCPDGCSPEYVAAVDEALDVANTPATALPLPTGLLVYRLPEPAWYQRGGLLRVALRTALRTLVAFASIAAIGVLGAAVLVDWFAPTAGPSACSAVQTFLVARGHSVGPDGVDGRGLYSNAGGRTPKSNTQAALQRELGTIADGRLDKPSPAIAALQRRLNAATTSTGKF